MRWILPGGAELGGRDHRGVEKLVAIRPGSAMSVGKTRPAAPEPTPAPAAPPVILGQVAVLSGPIPPDRLARIKLVLEIVAVLVGLAGAVWGLFGRSR